MRKSLLLHCTGILAACTLLPSVAHAASASASVTTDTTSSGGSSSGSREPDRGGLLAGAKIGGIVPFGHLNPFVAGAVELGYVAPWLHRSFALTLDADYTAPKKDGTSKDVVNPVRVNSPSGSYNWHITEQQLVLMPTVMYRMTFLGRLVTPYIAVGPRFYFLRGNVWGSTGGQAFEVTHEKGFKVGFGVPIGAEIHVGPGAIIGEVLIQYAKIDHRVTGNSNLGAANLFVGYRFLPMF